MIISKDSNNVWTPTAGGTGIWEGTSAQFELVKNSLPVNTIAYITDDGAGLVDVVENNNMNAVTSNAVYDALNVVGQVYNISPAAFTLSGSSQTVNCGTLNKGKYLIVVSLLNHISYGSCGLYVVGGSSMVVNMGRCESTGNTGQIQQTGTGFVNITTDNTPMVLVFSGSLSGQTNGDVNFWFVKAIRIG